MSKELVQKIRDINDRLHDLHKITVELETPQEYLQAYKQILSVAAPELSTVQKQMPEQAQVLKESLQMVSRLVQSLTKRFPDHAPEFGLADGEELSDPSNPENYLTTKNSTEGAEEYFEINNTPPSIEEYEKAIKDLHLPKDILAPALSRIIRSNLKLSPESYKQAVMEAVMADGREILDINSELFLNALTLEHNIPPALRDYIETVFNKALLSGKIETIFHDKKILADSNAIAFLEKNKVNLIAAIEGQKRSLGIINKKAPK